MRNLLITLGALLASCATTPAADDFPDAWAGIAAPELRAIGVVEVRQAFHGTVTHAEWGTAWVAIWLDDEDPNHGVQVVRISADRAGALQAGDIIVAVDSASVRSIADLTRLVVAWKQQRPLRLTVRRAGARADPIRPTLDGLPQMTAHVAPGS